MKRTRNLILLFLIIPLLTGCTGAQYTQQEYDQLQAAGKDMMTQWLSQHTGEGELLSICPHEHSYLSGPSYLTQFCQGEYREQGTAVPFLINTETGEVYTPAGISQFSTHMEHFTASALGLDAGDSAWTELEWGQYLTVKRGNSDTTETEYAPVLPAELTDAEQWLGDRAHRDPVWADGQITVSEGTDLSHWDLKALGRLEDEQGLVFRYLRIDSGSEHLSVQFGRHGDYERKAYADLGAFRLYGTAAERGEKIDSKNKVVTEYREYDLLRDIEITETEHGYQIRYSPDLAYEDVNGKQREANWHYILGRPEFVILADDTAPIRQYDYRAVMDGKERDCQWQQREDGWWELSLRGGKTFSFDMDLVRIE